MSEEENRNDLNKKALVSLLSDENDEIVEHVWEKISLMGDEMIPYLEKEWESNSDSIAQKRIENLIHFLQFRKVIARLKTWRDTNSDDILEGLWIVATYQYPELSLSELQKNIDDLYTIVLEEFKNDLSAYEEIKLLNSILFGKLKFQANAKNFHSPSNSMINVVLDTRLGNPISLCMIYMLICKRLNLPIFGVNLPNLFILTYKSDKKQFYINVFNKGLLFSRSDIENYIDSLHIEPNPIFFEPCTSIEIIKRVFRNLINAFERKKDEERVNEIRQLLAEISNEG